MGTFLVALTNLKSGSKDNKYNLKFEFMLENLFKYFTYLSTY